MKVVWLLNTLLLCIATGLSVTSNCPHLLPEKRVDCHPENGTTEERCLSRGCCWYEHDILEPGLPQCYYPKDYQGYGISLLEQSADAIQIVLNRRTPSGLPNDIQRVSVTIYRLTDTVVRIRITDAHAKRYEPPFPKLNIPSKPPTQPLYNVVFNQTGQITVSRVSTGKIVFTTDLRVMLFSDQLLQLSTVLPDEYLYGLGEHRDVFRKKATWQKYTFFNFDRNPEKDVPLYGSHPFHFSIEDDYGHASGTFLFNSNAMDIFLSPQPSITYRTVGGIFDFFIFVENSPEKLSKSYIGLLGLPPMPPLWSLGFHLCKYGYNSLEETINVWNRTRNALIPFDVQWNDIDYMTDRNDFTYDTNTFGGLPQFVQELHRVGMHYVVILDAGVSAGEVPGTYPPYDDGIEMDIFVKNASGNVLVGRTWNYSNKTAYPDFTHPNSTAYWTKQVQDLHSQFEFDGLWIDMNEISSFVPGSLDGCPESPLEDPPYVPGNEPLRTKTLCMTAQRYMGLEYDLHNLHSTFQARATKLALEKVRKGKRSFVLSRSSFAGLGHYASHWSGDIITSWEDMAWTIPSILEFNIYGVPLIGSDICGFSGDTTIELCARWSSLGAFYPFSRNHNNYGNKDHDPVAMGEIVIRANKFALDMRYRLLPYLYTLFYRAHKYAETVARPLFFVFPKDNTARTIETEFMWGDGLLIAPVLQEGATSVKAYLPAGRWYFIDTLTNVQSHGKYFTFDTPIDRINVLLRGGRVIAMADADLRTTTELHSAPFKIVAALDEDNLASGELYWDDGDSLNAQEKGNYNLIEFRVDNNALKIYPHTRGYKMPKRFSSVTILGLKRKPHGVRVNGNYVKFAYIESKYVLIVPLSDYVDILDSTTVSWS